VLLALLPALLLLLRLPDLLLPPRDGVRGAAAELLRAMHELGSM
jgi:hypothetical protein